MHKLFLILTLTSMTLSGKLQQRLALHLLKV